MIKEAIQDIVVDQTFKYIDMLNCLNFTTTVGYPDVYFNLRGKCAGKAYVELWEIHYNLKYIAHNLPRFLVDTVPHEVAHLMEYHISGKIGHKALWKDIMGKMGIVNPKRCHTYKEN